MGKLKQFRSSVLPAVMVAVCISFGFSQQTLLARAACFVAAGGFLLLAGSFTYAVLKGESQRSVAAKQS
jgi:hypothetical protein